MKGGRGLAFKLIALFTVGSAVIFSVIFWNNYRFFREMMERSVENNARNLASSTVNRVETVLNSVQKVPENLSCFLENDNLSKEEMLKVLQAVVGKDPEIFGASISFEPHAFDRDRIYFAPYCYKKGGKVESKWLGAADYQYFYEDWYQIPKELGRSVWSEPYFDKGGGNILMATYSVPFYKIFGGRRRFMGVVTADISLEWLRDIVSSIKVLRTGYGVLISKNGTVITHPLKQMIMNETIFSIAEARGDRRVRDLGRSMIRGETGFVPYVSISGKESFMYYTPIPSNGWTLSIVFPKDELFEDVTRLNREVLFLGASGIALLALMVVLIANSITRPLRAMAKAAEAVGRGDLEIELPPVKSGDEVGRLTAAFKKMQMSLKAYIRELTETTASKERIESELKIAHDIQMSILPKFFPPFPDKKELAVYALIEPAREVGGDFYDFFFIDDNHFCFVIADVSGKGMPASLFMAVTKTLIKATAAKGIGPDMVLFSVNNELSQDNDSSMFVTIFCGILNTVTGDVYYSNGGHNPPLVMRKAGETGFLEISSGLVVGALKDFAYITEHLVLLPGDSLFLYTDGVTEAMNGHDGLFSEERLLRQLERLREKPAKEIIGGLMEELVFFSEDAPQSDDITMMMITFRGEGAQP